MEQLSIRDWMVIIGAMMIAAVLIDAVRRYWRERRAEIKLNARIDRSAPLSDDDAFNLLTELPNGGARIIRRDDLFEDGVPNQTLPGVPEESQGRTLQSVASLLRALGVEYEASSNLRKSPFWEISFIPLSHGEFSPT